MTRTSFKWRQHWVMGLHLTVAESSTLYSILARFIPKCSKAEALIANEIANGIDASLLEEKP